MVGITSYGAYVPMMRLPFSAISGGGRKATGGGGERAIAYFDEDALTMAVAAATDCLRGIDRATVGGVLFASTSYPYKEKQGASVIAKALDLRRDIVRLEHHAARLGEPLDGYLALEPLELCIWDAGHRDPPTNSLYMRRTAN